LHTKAGVNPPPKTEFLRVLVLVSILDFVTFVWAKEPLIVASRGLKFVRASIASRAC
jgi:hypothetical protein